MNKSLADKTALDKVILAVLIALNSLFLIYWVILAYYSPLHFDDLHFLWKMREMSLFDYVKEMYFTRSGRFVGYAMNGVKSIVVNALGFHQLWPLVYYALGLGVCWLVVKDLKLNVSKAGLFMGMCFVYNVYVLTNIDFPVFFWLCAMGYYLSLPNTCLFLKYLNMEKLKGWQWAILVLLAVLNGGGGEVSTAIVLLMMFVCGMYWWHSKGWNVKETWALPQVRRIVWIALLLIVLLVIVVAAPGNYSRMSDTAQFVHPKGLYGWIMGIGEAVVMFFYFMAFYVPYYLIIFVLAYYVGGKMDMELHQTKIKIVVKLVLIFMAYLVIASLPNVYLYGGFGIQRTYTHIVFALLLTIIAIGMVLGLGNKSSKPGWIAVVGLSSLAVIMCVNIINDTPTARTYKKAVDDRIDGLCALRDKGQKETVEVAPLPVPYTEDPKHLILHLFGKETPKSTLYYISDTKTEPNEYEYHMKQLLGLDFDFVLADEKALDAGSE